MQHAHKEVLACTKLCARKSIKTLLSSTQMLLNVVSCFCLKEDNIRHKKI